MKERFPRSVFGVGEEPDPRFTLANERTFLAWIRTALAFFLAGVALEALNAPIEERLRLAASIAFIALGLVAVVHGWASWAATERSMRRARPLPGFAMGAILTGGAAVAIALVVIGTFLG